MQVGKRLVALETQPSIRKLISTIFSAMKG
jgi:hypothetical protein